ncbi:hypothetical protein PhaeoP48_01195 [Phaeobacter inhibens]|nr:hypothetical protein PhaeoP48_01195 [Phaeobacter inhibens]
MRKSKFATQPRSFWPQRCGEPRAFSRATRQPSRPPHSRSLAANADLRALLRTLTFGQPLAPAATLKSFTASAISSTARKLASSAGDKDTLVSSILYGSGSGSGMVSFGLSEIEPFGFAKSLFLLDLGLPPLAPFARFFSIFSCVFSQVSSNFFCEISPSRNIRKLERRALILRHFPTVRPRMRALSRSSSGTQPLRRHMAPSSSI